MASLNDRSANCRRPPLNANLKDAWKFSRCKIPLTESRKQSDEQGREVTDHYCGGGNRPEINRGGVLLPPLSLIASAVHLLWNPAGSEVTDLAGFGHRQFERISIVLFIVRPYGARY